MQFEPIGRIRRLTEVESSRDQPERMELVLEPRYVAGLKGIEEFSHLHVIFHFHQRPPEDVVLTVRPEKRADMPELGVFSTCSPTRPNSIGMTMVRLEAVRGNVLTVSGLDAWDDTPLIDIKPVMEIPENHRIPGWLVRLWEEDGQ